MNPFNWFNKQTEIKISKKVYWREVQNWERLLNKWSKSMETERIINRICQFSIVHDFMSSGTFYRHDVMKWIEFTHWIGSIFRWFPLDIYRHLVLYSVLHSNICCNTMLKYNIKDFTISWGEGETYGRKNEVWERLEKKTFFLKN